MSLQVINRNGLVVEFNDICSALLGCNTNLSILGSDEQAKAALCYLLKYITKSPTELIHSIALLYHARRTIEVPISSAGLKHRTQNLHALPQSNHERTERDSRDFGGYGVSGHSRHAG